MARPLAPFSVRHCLYGKWDLWRQRVNGGPRVEHVKCFDTQGEAIDYAYRNWPWWP